MPINAKLPCVTVITPAYNRATFLDETILSVLRQDYPFLEYIILDDGSTDNTQEVLAKYKDKVRIESHSNMGETRTVNRGFSLATGEIIGVVNSDDPLLPGSINRIVETLLSQPEILIAYPDWHMVNDKGEVVEHIQTYEYSYINMLRWHHCMPGPGTFFRRSVIEQLGGRDPQFRYVGDFDFWLRAGLLGAFIRIPETLATFRVHSDSASISQQNLLMGEEHIRLVNKIYSIPELPTDIKKIMREAISSANYVAGVVCGASSTLAKIKYFSTAIYYAPLKYLGEYRKRLVAMLYHIAASVR
jgi:glycosyltransferase involved in cell wall biosynthesis